MSKTLHEALAAIPKGLLDPLISEFEAMLSEYRSGRWESVGLKAGKICEIVHSILAGYVAGSYPAAPSKPRNMVDACRALENASSTFSRPVRIQIPRLVAAIYELRNNRSIGHVGGDVDPNHMDAELFVRSTKWMVAELVREFAKLSLGDAAAVIESITEKNIPAVWEAGDFKKVLNPKLSARDKALVLAYSSPDGVSAKNLGRWCEYSNLSRFRSTVVAALNKQALVHFDTKTDMVTITPVGIRTVETSGLLIVK